MRDAGKALGMLCAWIIAWADGAWDFFCVSGIQYGPWNGEPISVLVEMN